MWKIIGHVLGYMVNVSVFDDHFTRRTTNLGTVNLC
jgi:hypothetical protein